MHPRWRTLSGPESTTDVLIDGTELRVPGRPIPFEDLYLLERSRLIGVLAAMSGDRDLAEDVTQDAFAHAWVRWERVQRCPSPAGWVYTTAFRMLRRRLGRAKLPMGRPVERDALDAAGVRLDLIAAMRSLPARQMQLVALRHIAGLSTEEVADRLGMRDGAVRTGLHRAMVNLRRTLEPTRSPTEP